MDDLNLHNLDLPEMPDFPRPMGVLEAEGRMMHAAIVGRPLQSAMPKHFFIYDGDECIDCVEAINHLDAMAHAIEQLGLASEFVSVIPAK